MTLIEAISRYRSRFDEGPPVIGMEEDEAIEMILDALEKGKPITEGPEITLPKGAII